MGESFSKMGYAEWLGEDAPLRQGDESDSDVASSEGSPRSPSADPADTLIIFDWDDTLLCSSAINAHQWSPQQLQQLEWTVHEMLQAAMALGETMIVTNGAATWVQESAQRFFPHLQPTLRRVAVVSARAAYEQRYPNDPFRWKRRAFRDILRQRRGQRPAAGGVNLVVIGDSPAEIQAARRATCVLGAPSFVKTVKLKEAPSVDELLGQLRSVLQELKSIVLLEGDASKDLVRHRRTERLPSCAAGWRLSESPRRAPLEDRSWLIHGLA